MSKVNQIQSAILSLGPGAYQKLMDVYLFKRFSFNNIVPLGSHTGTDKTTKGTPDSYVHTDNGKFVLIAYGSVGETPFKKIEKDILSCLDKAKTELDINDIEQIICCHTSTNITPGQTKQLCSHFPNTMIIGLGEIAIDLYLKYPFIAKKELLIEIDTHQIFDISDYVEYASKNAYSTSLNMPLLCRENELEKIGSLLDAESVVLICGKSGTGKTRLALEVAMSYTDAKKCGVKIIKSNNENIYDDLMTTFSDDKDFLILIDDANQLVQLGHLLDLSKSANRVNKIKFLMTVRDYAKEKLMRTIKSAYTPQIYNLEPLLDESIAQVLTKNLGITNDSYIRQIQKIAKGNVRLAIMAGTCSIKDNFGSIQNAFDIFDFYFADIIEEMNYNEQLAASLIAFFDSFLLQSSQLPIVIASESGIDFSNFVEISNLLHTKEIVSIFDNQAIKFEDQNLRDYLLYYVLFKKKWLKLSHMICRAFPAYQQKIVFVCNTLIQLFYNEENLQYIEVEIKKAWTEIQKRSDEDAFRFVLAFHNVIPDETLIMVKQKILALPAIRTDFLSYDFEKTSNNHKIDSELLQLLISFKHSSHFADALELAFFHVEQNTENPMDFFFMFGKDWGFDHESYKYDYKQEMILVEKLSEYYMKQQTIESALCLLFCISNCLKLEFSTAESNGDRGITFYQFGILACEPIFKIRTQCINELAVLFENPQVRPYAKKILLSYPSHNHLDTDKEIVMHDIAALTEYFLSRLSGADFESCEILYHFHLICQRHKLEPPNWLIRYEDNRIFTLYLSIKEDYTHMDLNWVDAKSLRTQTILELCRDTKDEDFTMLWQILENRKGDSNNHDNWKINSGIAIIFDVLSKDYNRFISIVGSYLSHNAPFGDRVTSLVSSLTICLGYDTAIKFIENKEFDDKKLWLTQVYDRIPDCEINEAACNRFIAEMYCQTENSRKYYLSIDTVLRISNHFHTFTSEYITALNEVCEKTPWVLSEFLGQLDLRDEMQITEFVDYFVKDIDLIEDIYIGARRGRREFDYEGRLLMQIVRKDNNFLATVVRELMHENYYSEDYCFLNILWDQSDCDKLILSVVDTVRESSSQYRYYNPFGEHLFSYRQDKQLKWKKQDDWISNYISKNSSVIDAMEFLFAIVRNLSDEQRKQAILCFCDCNKEYNAFCKIPLLPSMTSWSGSEVPIIEKRISFVNGLKNELHGLEFIEHRAYLSERIQILQREKENVLLQEFIENR